VTASPRDPGEGPFDVIVVGAGINGAGIARDAALRGLRVLLLDKGDIASGTTSWSTRLIHGGLRYLEHFEVPLVRESLRERERLLHIAPHLVHPLSFFIPIYEEDKRGPMLVRAGMVAYDALSFDKSLDNHSMLDAEGALEREPGIRQDGLRGAAVYYDAQAEFPERLAVENAVSARDAGAAVVPYARVERLLVQDGAVVGVEWTDVAPGARGARRQARGAVTVNVTGPWVDEVLGGLDRPPAEPLVGGTKGSHLVVRDFDGAPDEALYASADDGRPYFIVPWNDLYLIGTTDSRYRGDLDEVVADDDEIDYLIGATNELVPRARLTRDDVLYTYSGVRPLPYDDGDEGSVTRRHIVHDHGDAPAGLISIVGGKLTTYRNLAEQTVDKVFEKLDRDDPGSRTAAEQLPGGRFDDRDALEAELREADAEPRAASRLVRLYGARAREIVALANGDADLAEPIDERSGALGAEVAFALDEELALRLEDILLRRTMLGLGPDVGIGADERAARAAVAIGAWDEARAADEVRAYREHVERLRPHRRAGGAAPRA
jgi:glycerol-3-phosphate dehydrogenase